MFKNFFNKDIILSTIAVFLVYGFLALIPLNLHILDPFKMAIRDFDFNDLAWSEMGKGTQSQTDNRIVVINIGNYDRAGIAKTVAHAFDGQPKVVGVDVLFEGAREPMTDSILRQQLEAHPNLILANKLNIDHEKETLQQNYFATAKSQTAYVNFVGEETGVIRHLKPSITIEGKQQIAFAPMVAKMADGSAYQKLIDRKKEAEVINYTRSADKYQILQADDFLADSNPTLLLKDKIVLLGYVSETSTDILDKHYTPMNHADTGKGVPDMNGVIIHANTISMILDGNYINKAAGWISWLIAFILCWLHMTFFIHFYIEKHIWFHLAAKTAQLFLAIFFVYMGLLLFFKWNYQISMAPTLAVVILAVDVLYFYEALVVWLQTKNWYKTIFYHENHH
ncbi:CHASE2 domain-containing protein [Pedobacter sp. MW01-1-1]|uniref:CHASE2 domain-containing protein n=1 Tax=Pedobacter sp. MW01-1-1 TaxID=3383027 RepID=UPI003FEFE685